MQRGHGGHAFLRLEEKRHANFPPRMTHFSEDPTRKLWPMEPCRSMVLGWDLHVNDWDQLDCQECLEHRPS